MGAVLINQPHMQYQPQWMNVLRLNNNIISIWQSKAGLKIRRKREIHL